MDGVLRRLSSPTFVGRAEELAVLDGALQRASSGSPAFAFVAGESGVGKSRLIAEFEARALEAGAQVFVGHCLELGGTVIPYAPLLDALRPVARELALCGEELRDSLTPQTRLALAELMPEFGSKLDLPAGPGDERTGNQSRLFEGLLALLERLGAQAPPLVLVLEDLHWADASTRDFLTFLVRSARTEPLCLVATYRSDELHRRHPLRPVLAELERVSGVDRLGLERFDREEVEALVAAILDHPDPGLAERLFARAEGNALYTEELLAASADDGCTDLPESLRDALLTRIERLPVAAQAVVRVAAVTERPLHHGLLEAVCDHLSSEDLMAGAREAVAGQVLVARPDGTYAFRHALVGEAVYEDLLPGERITLHAAIAEALELDPYLLGELSSSGVAAEMAMHYHAAHDLPRALPASVEAGVAAERVFAYREAMRHFERALEIWPRVPDAAERADLDLAELLRLASHSANYAGESARSIGLAQRAVQEVDEVAEPLHAARMYAHLGKLLRGGGVGDESLAAYERAMALLPAGETLERARLRDAQATHLMLRGRYTEAVAPAAEAAEAARELRVRDLESRALNTQGFSLAALGDVDTGLEMLQRALTLAADAPPADYTRAVVNLSEILDRVGRTEEALALIQAAIPLAAQRPELSSYDAFTALQEVDKLIRLGRLDEAEAALPASVPGDAIGSASIMLVFMRAELAYQRGDATLRTHLDAWRRLSTRTRDPQWHEPLESLAAQLAADEGRFDDARAAIDRGLAMVRDTEDGLRHVHITWAGLRVEAEAAARSRDLGECVAAERTDELLAELERALAKPAQWSEGEPYAQLARAEAARVHHADGGAPPDPAGWTAPAAAFGALGLRYPAAYARLREAEAWLLAGDREAAATALTASTELARAMGAAGLLGEAEALGRRGRLRTAPAGTTGTAGEAATGEDDPAHRLGLTPRELEVLLLVAEGRTNREIGATLFMSEKTASVHVSRILAKLDVGGRVEAAAVAHRLGLTAAARA
jgi:DNA-binding CsgD family transcriptional regulator/tetratricopeptide (TPR) repeat protein